MNGCDPEGTLDSYPATLNPIASFGACSRVLTESYTLGSSRSVLGRRAAWTIG
jgi:hypothetical protein